MKLVSRGEPLSFGTPPARTPREEVGLRRVVADFCSHHRRQVIAEQTGHADPPLRRALSSTRKTIPLSDARASETSGRAASSAAMASKLAPSSRRSAPSPRSASARAASSGVSPFGGQVGLSGRSESGGAHAQAASDGYGPAQADLSDPDAPRPQEQRSR
jgi:hypothetical protein